jgi:type IV secretion system protein TrbL
MDFNLLTTVLTTFVNALAAGQHSVQSAGGTVMRALAVIEIVLAGLWMSMDGTSMAAPFKKLLQLSFWVWFATSFPTLTKAFSDSLVQLGLSAGGQGGNVALLLDPSRIAGMALDATQPLVQSMDDAGLTHLKDAIVMGLCYLIIMACFFIIACQVCLAVVEYYLIVTLATCLIPFGISSHTKFLAEKAIGAVVAVSVKLMVLSFIIGLIQPVLGQIRFSGGGEIKLNEVMAMILVCGLLAVVVWRAPGFASDLLAASPSLSVAAVGQHVTSAVSSGARATSGAVSAGIGATREAASMVRSGATGAIGAVRMVGAAVTAGARGGEPAAAATNAAASSSSASPSSTPPPSSNRGRSSGDRQGPPPKTSV